jgi:acetyltransferase-like isoleucine patch superfamily enzyme
MLYAFENMCPQFDASEVYVADNATLIGDVRLASGASIWWGAVLRADNAPIRIGENSNIQDGSILHTDPGYALQVDQQVIVGHMAMLHGCHIGAGSLIGIQAVVLNGAQIGRSCLIGAKALVTEGMVIPDGSLVLGSPGKVVRQLTNQEREALLLSAASYVDKAQRYRVGLQPVIQQM